MNGTDEEEQTKNIYSNTLYYQYRLHQISMITDCFRGTCSQTNQQIFTDNTAFRGSLRKYSSMYIPCMTDM